MEEDLLRQRRVASQGDLAPASSSDAPRQGEPKQDNLGWVVSASGERLGRIIQPPNLDTAPSVLVVCSLHHACRKWLHLDANMTLRKIRDWLQAGSKVPDAARHLEVADTSHRSEHVGNLIPKIQGDRPQTVLSL